VFQPDLVHFSLLHPISVSSNLLHPISIYFNLFQYISVHFILSLTHNPSVRPALDNSDVTLPVLNQFQSTLLQSISLTFSPLQPIPLRSLLLYFILLLPISLLISFAIQVLGRLLPNDQYLLSQTTSGVIMPKVIELPKS
jgi:hypothetical protein